MTNWSRRRAWESVTIQNSGSSFVIFLDKKLLLSPKGNEILLPTKKLANRICEEWHQQKKIVEPLKMPFTRLVNSAIDKVAENFESIIKDLVSYGDTDLVCYRTNSPQDLVLRQKKYWDPILDWSKTELKINLKTVRGIRYQAQDKEELEKISQEIITLDPLSLTAFYELVTISGSILIALAVIHKHITAEEGLDISFLDEDWQREKWGQDEESIKNKANKLDEFLTAFQFLELLK